MNAKELPLADSPIVGYMMYSYHLAVTFTHVDAWPWFFSNYVQLQCDPSQLSLSQTLKYTAIPKGEIHFTEGTWRYNPWLAASTQIDKATIASNTASVAQFCAEQIERDYYVETFVDEYFIPALFNGERTHFRHRLLLFGYDSAKRRLNIIGFDKNKQYRKLECSYDEFEQAFAAVSPQWFETTKLYKPHPAAHAVDFALDRLQQLLRDYLSGTNTSLNPDLHGDRSRVSDVWYGVKCYEFLGDYIRGVMEQGVKRPDIRGFHMLWEHKKCMLQRMSWMHNNGHAATTARLQEYRRVVGLSEIVRNAVLMYVVKTQSTGAVSMALLADIPRQLEEARRIESELLHETLTRLAA